MTRHEAVELLERLLSSNRFESSRDYAVTAVQYLEQRGLKFESPITRDQIVERNQAIMEYLERKDKL